LKPRGGNANYSTSGQLSPLLNDPYYLTMGLGTRIFLGGAQGYIIGPGTQHRPGVKRGQNGVPLSPAGTLMVTGNLKEMHPRWIAGVSMLGYGCSLAVGVGVPIPILNAEMELKSGKIHFQGEEVPTVPLSSHIRALEIAHTLKEWIEKGEFLLTEPQKMLPTVPRE